MNLGHGYTRIEGEAGDTYRTYEIITTPLMYRFLRKVKVTEVIVSYEDVTIIGGGFGKIQTFRRGTRDYDARVAQLNALEDGIYQNEKYWKQLAAAYHTWKLAGCPPGWGRRVAYIMFSRYSPLTWL